MATSRSKSGSSGVRILWIPGKKKQPKGSYNPTRKSNLSPHHQQKKIEQWSLGGSKGQEELLKAEIPGSDMASPSIINCLPQTLGISAATTCPKPEEGAVGGEGDAAKPKEAANGSATGEPTSLNGFVNIKTDLDQQTPPQPLSPRLGPLANIDEDEHENDIEDTKDDYCGASSNTATLLLKDRKMHKKLNAMRDEKEEICGMDDEEKKKDRPDGVPYMRGLNRKQALERTYRDQQKEREVKSEKQGKKEKDKKKTGMNEKAVDCLYVGLMCCECSIQ